MKTQQTAVRTSLDLPRELHRRLHEAAAREGRSARKLMLEDIESGLVARETGRSMRRLDLDTVRLPLGERKINLTNEEIYELIEFP